MHFSAVTRGGKRLADFGLQSWTRLRRRIVPAGLDDAVFHLPRHGIAVDDRSEPPPGVSVWCVRHERLVRLAPAVDLCGVGQPQLDRDMVPTLPLLVASIEDGRILGRRGAVIARGGRLLANFSPCLGHPDPDRHPALSRYLWMPPPRRVAGTLIVATNAGAGNYYHWLIEGLQRLLAAQAHGNHGRPLDLVECTVAVSRSRLPAVTECLRQLGLDPVRVIPVGPWTSLTADRVVAATVPTAALGATAASVAVVDEAFAQRGPHEPAGRTASRRLVLLRRGTRSLLNEADLLETLKPFGFEPVRLEQLSFDGQRSVFAQAEAVIAPHGAGLANLIWRRGPCRVLELFPANYLNPCFRRLSAAVSENLVTQGLTEAEQAMRHDFLISDPPRLPDDRRRQRLIADLEAVRAWASGLGAHASSGSMQG
jgi:hypothetical protein